MSTAPQAKVLVVEDETVTALDIQQSLRQRGYAVTGVATTAEEALQNARQERPDIVLMDIRLRGDTDGIEAARQLRAELNVPIVFLTAYADGATLRRAKAAEPFAYLLKPFEDEILATTLEVALHKHRAHELLLAQTTGALYLSEQRFARLAQELPEHAVIMLDPMGKILSWNTGAEHMHGWGAEETLGRDYSLLYPPELVQQGKPLNDLQVASRAGRHAEYGSQMRKDGSRFSASMLSLVLRNRSGQLAGFLKLSRPVRPADGHN